jgi:hypothetical protein
MALTSNNNNNQGQLPLLLLSMRYPISHVTLRTLALDLPRGTSRRPQSMA